MLLPDFQEHADQLVYEGYVYLIVSIVYPLLQ